MGLLEIRNLSVEFATAAGPFRAVDGIDLDVAEGEVLGVSASPARARAPATACCPGRPRSPPTGSTSAART